MKQDWNMVNENIADKAGVGSNPSSVRLKN